MEFIKIYIYLLYDINPITDLSIQKKKNTLHSSWEIWLLASAKSFKSFFSFSEFF